MRAPADLEASTIDAAREGVERELLALQTTRQDVPDLDDIRRGMPQANGDQDTW
jgi:hypothetical protein